MAVDLPELPQPGPSQVEIMFRRMLLQCMHRAQHARLTEGGADWQSDPKFHYVRCQANLCFVFSSLAHFSWYDRKR
jgi:hypothetical protein